MKGVKKSKNFEFFYEGNIACDISGIQAKEPYAAAFMGERYVRIEISDFVMRAFALFALFCLLSLICPLTFL